VVLIAEFILRIGQRSWIPSFIRLELQKKSYSRKERLPGQDKGRRSKLVKSRRGGWRSKQCSIWDLQGSENPEIKGVC